MATLITNKAQWSQQSATQNQMQQNSLWNKWIAFTDTQAKNQTFWFLLALIGQGVLFLPIPALLMYYYDASITVLAITLTMFFANFIAGMGGSGIRVTLTLLLLSVLVNLAMLLVYII